MSQTSKTEKRQALRCSVCKHPLPCFQARGRKRHYCSRSCKLKAYRARKKAVPHQKRSKRKARPSALQATCLVCERPLVQRKTGRKTLYYSANCKQKAYRKRRNVTQEKYREALRNNLLRLKHKSIEWYTPQEYLQAVHLVLVDIELDPASSEDANQTVGARRFFDGVCVAMERKTGMRILNITSLLTMFGV